MSMGQHIKEARLKAGITQAELADKLGIPYQSIGQWERGLRTPKIETLRKIAKALGIHIVELITGESVIAYTDYDDFVEDIRQDMIDNADTPEEYEGAHGLKLLDIKEQLLLQEVKQARLKKINDYFDKLNEEGQEKAVERIKELGMIPEYQKK